jgi:phenylacetate-coenzyme A ligase PaaK-like adenylate-forming protein
MTGFGVGGRPETFSERFHRLLYAAIQQARGRPLAHYLRQLQVWEQLGKAEFACLRRRRLGQTLTLARERVPLYRSAEWSGARVGDDADALRSWPVLERRIVQTRGSELLAQPQGPRVYFKRTSGSTGWPLAIGIDPEGAAWAWANDFRGLAWHGIPLGAHSVSLRPRTEGAFAEWVRNRYAVPGDDLSPERLARTVRHLLRRRTTYVWGYTSAVVELARQASALGTDVPRPLVPFAKVFGEMLYPFQRRQIEDGLGARVIETYGCNETGTIAYECPEGSLHVFAEQLELEIVRDGEPVPPGEMGDILLTCFGNRAMPLVRYRVEDRGRLLPDPCRCGRPHPVLADVEGRSGDLLVTAAGRRVHGTAALGAVLKHAAPLLSPQALARVLFIQEEQRRWRILVQAGPTFGDEDAARLIESLRETFGAECRVAVEVVPEIPREPSGKFRFYRSDVAPSSLEVEGVVSPLTSPLRARVHLPRPS